MTTKFRLPTLNLLIISLFISFTLESQPKKFILWDVHDVIIQDTTRPTIQDWIKGNTLATIDIIERLKDFGYKQYLGSNMSTNCLKYLVTESPLAPFFIHNFNIAQSQVANYDPNNPKIIIKKPDARFFQLFLEKSNITNPQDVIFIDDRIKHVQGAQRIGMQAILFTSPEQIAADLEQLLNISLAAAKAMTY